MNKMIQRLAPAIGVCVLLAGLHPAVAAETDHWMVKGTITGMNPQRSSDKLNNISNSKLYLDDAITGEVSVLRMLNPHVGIGFYTAWPYSHELKGNNRLSQLGMHNFADVKQMPAGFSGQFHFLPDALIQPYLGINLEYAHFFDEKDRIQGIHTSIKDAWGVGGEAGLDFRLGKHWRLTTSARYIHMNTKVKLSGLIDQEVSMDLDPWYFSIGAGYRF